MIKEGGTTAADGIPVQNALRNVERYSRRREITNYRYQTKPFQMSKRLTHGVSFDMECHKLLDSRIINI